MKPQESEAFRRDWLTIMVVLLLVALIVAVATFELWIPHGSIPHVE